MEINHPGFGSYGDSGDEGSDAGVNPRSGCDLRSAYKCPKCKKQFAMFNKIKKCSDHNGEEEV